MIILCSFQSDPALLPRKEMFSLFAEVISTSPDTIKGSRLQVDIFIYFKHERVSGLLSKVKAVAKKIQVATQRQKNKNKNKTTNK